MSELARIRVWRGSFGRIYWICDTCPRQRQAVAVEQMAAHQDLRVTEIGGVTWSYSESADAGRKHLWQVHSHKEERQAWMNYANG